MAQPIKAANPILQSPQSRKIPEPPVVVGILPAILVLCAPEIIAAGLCGAAAICTYIQGGKPVTLRCPTLGDSSGGFQICGVIVLQGAERIVLKLCLLLTASLSEQLAQIQQYEDEASDQAYRILEAKTKMCWSEFPPVLSPIGEVLSTTPEFDACLKAAADWIKDMLITIRNVANEMRRRATARDGNGDRGPLPIGVSRQ
jgi:hypothetical protein